MENQLVPLFMQKKGTFLGFFNRQRKTVLNSTLKVIPNDKTKTQIENYLGPRRYLAGGKKEYDDGQHSHGGFDNQNRTTRRLLLNISFFEQCNHCCGKHRRTFWQNIYSNTNRDK
jgi:hypothetical protein